MTAYVPDETMETGPYRITYLLYGRDVSSVSSSTPLPDYWNWEELEVEIGEEKEGGLDLTS